MAVGNVAAVGKDNYKWLALSTVALGTFMGPVDASVVNIALPTLSAYFNVSITYVEWVVTGYLLVISSLLFTYGRLGDLYGHKPVYLAGFAIFTASSLLAGLSPTIQFLIGARVVQAIGSGMMMAIGPALITATFPASERGKALGINGMTVAAGLSVGPVLGGYLVHLFGWESIFFINLPIGVIGMLWAWRVLRWDRRTTRQTFDVPGAAFLFAAIFCLLLFLSQGRAWGWGSAPIVTLLSLTVLFGVLFTVVELRHRDPMMDLRLFKNRLFALASVSSLLNFMAQTAMVFLMPFYLQDLRNLEPSQAGMVMMAFPAILLFGAPIAGSLSDRIGSRSLASIGMTITTASLLFLSRLGPATAYTQIVWALMLFGLGMALFQAPNSSAIMGSVPKNRLGTGSSMLASMRNIGMVTGTAISAAVYDGRLVYHTSSLVNRGYSGLELKGLAFSNSLQEAYLVAAALAFIGIFTSLARPGQSRKQPGI